MSKLRERTTYFKTCDDGEADIDVDGGWVDIKETRGGGAIIRPNMEMLIFLDKIFAKSMKRADEFGKFDVELSKDGTMLCFKEKTGEQMKFDKVMKLVFG